MEGEEEDVVTFGLKTGSEGEGGPGEEEGKVEKGEEGVEEEEREVL